MGYMLAEAATAAPLAKSSLLLVICMTLSSYLVAVIALP
ncbi:hypothetical protein X971_3289 [Agrobacterium tumefaciens LBA4213 (Ach5)]|nr:hypothetical protein X971_3289 [Agrobacterium tumefaciens LBA4213 (Ach5)]